MSENNGQKYCKDCKFYTTYYIIVKSNLLRSLSGACTRKRKNYILSDNCKACKKWEDNKQELIDKKESAENALIRACKEISEYLKVMRYFNDKRL